MPLRSLSIFGNSFSDSSCCFAIVSALDIIIPFAATLDRLPSSEFWRTSAPEYSRLTGTSCELRLFFVSSFSFFPNLDANFENPLISKNAHAPSNSSYSNSPSKRNGVFPASVLFSILRTTIVGKYVRAVESFCSRLRCSFSISSIELFASYIVLCRFGN